MAAGGSAFTNPVLHNDNVLESCEGVMRRWHDSIDAQTGHRCPRCWLRSYECYCQELRGKLQGKGMSEVAIEKADVCIYYHFLEVGRSANTGHLMQQLAPSATSSIVFANAPEEDQLVEEIVREYQQGDVRTCIMYPSTDAVLLSEWMANRTNNSSNRSSSSSCSSSSTTKRPARLVALDGTYKTAVRQIKHLQKCLAAAGVPMPVVKLDLDEKGCRSAVYGMMNQPDKEKICTFQAIVLALRQMGEDEQTCQLLLRELDEWIGYILRRRIKIGKEKLRVPTGFQRDELAPSSEMQSQLDSNHAYSRKARNSTSVHVPRTKKVIKDEMCATGEFVLVPTRRFSVLDLTSRVQGREVQD